MNPCIYAIRQNLGASHIGLLTVDSLRRLVCLLGLLVLPVAYRHSWRRGCPDKGNQC
jgi:hypothetical protein